MMAFESGIDKVDLERAILPRLLPKVIYVEGWVYIPNFGKYHNSNTSDAQKGFKRAFDAVPDRIRLKIKEIERDGGTGGSRAPSAFASAITSISANAQKYMEVPEIQEEDTRTKTPAKYPHSKEVFSWFPAPQPSWKIDTTQLKHAELLFERGEDAVRGILKFVGKHKDDEFFPKVVKPSDLERKWEDIAAYKV